MPCEVVRWVDRMNRFEDVLVVMRLICQQVQKPQSLCAAPWIGRVWTYGWQMLAIFDYKS